MTKLQANVTDSEGQKIDQVFMNRIRRQNRTDPEECWGEDSDMDIQHNYSGKDKCLIVQGHLDV